MLINKRIESRKNMDRKISGIKIYYYKVCKRKLWYFSHNIGMEQGNEHVEVGRLIDENSYARDEKHYNINNEINIDFIRNHRVIHEIKKSKKIEEASIFQVKYYLYYLKERGVTDIIGRIDYPLLRDCVEVQLTLEDEIILQNTILDIIELENQECPPELIKKKICKECAYHDLCFI